MENDELIKFLEERGFKTILESINYNYKDMLKLKEQYEESKPKIVNCEYKDLEQLQMEYMNYGSHEYVNFINDYVEDIYDNLDDNERFQLLKELYTGAKDCQYIGELLIEEANDNGVPIKEKENIANAFDNKEKIIAYRGVNEYNLKDGSSYTLDKSIAEWFADRFGEGGYVIDKEITQDDVIFYNNDREEREVFIY